MSFDLFSSVSCGCPPVPSPACRPEGKRSSSPAVSQRTVAQYAGRLHRFYDGKRVVHVYDYADVNVPMLARMFDGRCRGYEAIGYTVLLPASAVPGWPADVRLPSDPFWKRDYSGSVRRLVRDGVDSPLASLFMHAARPAPADADGAARARSATERSCTGALRRCRRRRVASG